MVGSWIGRLLVALPGVLASLAVGMVVAGLTREIALSAAVVALLVGIVLVRVASLGVIIDVDREAIVLRTFFRTRRIGVDELRLIDARGIGESWPPGVRFVTVSGDEYGSMALCYLDEVRAEQFIGNLQAVASPDAEVALSPSSFRPSVG